MKNIKVEMIHESSDSCMTTTLSRTKHAYYVGCHAECCHFFLSCHVIGFWRNNSSLLLLHICPPDV